jgi:hypothetical protein
MNANKLVEAAGTELFALINPNPLVACEFALYQLQEDGVAKAS